VSAVPDYPRALLPDAVAARRVETATGLSMRVLEAGAGADRPLALLLHGFPELAFSWRKVMPALAEMGFHVVAPDQRGYGGTEGPAGPERCAPPDLVRDALAFVHALGRKRVGLLVGHDFGAVVAAWAALIRPDVFRAVALMSAPFGGPPGWDAPLPLGLGRLEAGLAALERPRKHYQVYFSTRSADADMRWAPEGLPAFLHAYVHMKSGDWEGDRPEPLPDARPESMARLPEYYVMDKGATMPESVRPHAPKGFAPWLPEAALEVYAATFGARGFQGGLDWYAANTDPERLAALRLWAGRRIEVPACFVAGARDWGIRQKPGDLERMEREACADWRGTTLVEGAGHWVQQEAPEAVIAALGAFVRGL
jgi:pimeloyl-ACP methyl ester carboxylesterase